MVYVKHVWVNGDTSKPLDATRLNEVEDGIFLADATANSAAATALAASTTANAAQVAADLDADTAALVGDAGTATGTAIAEATVDSTGKQINTIAVADGRTLRAPMGDARARGMVQPNFERIQKDLFPFTGQDLSSWISPVVIPVEGLVAGALAKYYAYYSTDHDDAEGGIALITFDDPYDPDSYVDRGLVYVDTVVGKQTETPDVHWNAEATVIEYGAGLTANAAADTIAQVPGDLLANGQPVRVMSAGTTGLSTTGTFYVVNAGASTFQLAGVPGGTVVDIAANSTVTLNLVGALFMYYQQDLITAQDQQLTLLAYSRDGLTWTRHGIVIDGNERNGIKHTGYAKVVRVGREWVAFHLLAGGARAIQGISTSKDGIYWYTDPVPIYWDINFAGADGDPDPEFKVAWIGTRPFLWNGQYWTLLTATPFGVFGGQFGGVHMTAAPLDPSLRRFAAPPIKIDLDKRLPGEGRLAGGPGNLFLHDDGTLLGFYISSTIETPSDDWTQTSLGLIRQVIPE